MTVRPPQTKGALAEPVEFRRENLEFAESQTIFGPEAPKIKSFAMVTSLLVAMDKALVVEPLTLKER